MPNKNNLFDGGVLILDKPSGFTSHDAVARVRKLFDTRQVGHTGTLDPSATGVLPILVGRAVKASEYLSAHDKRYVATFRLGFVSDTGDSDSDLRATGAPIPHREAVLAAAAAMRGAQMQTPPMISAIKVDGKRLLDYARAGKTVEAPPRPIEIYEIAALPREDGDYTLTLHVSKGTYVRTVIGDLGRALGCGAVMTSLRRTACADFTLDDALTLDRLEAMTKEARLAALLPAERAFADLAKLALEPFFATLCQNGCEIYQKKIGAAFPAGTRLRLYDQRGFFGVGEVRDFDAGSAVKMVKLLRV